MNEFAHLHVHSEFSLLDGACRITALIERVAALGQKHIALTDHGVMYGAIDFYRAAKAKGLHPIIGCEVYLAPRSRHDRGYTNGEWHTHLILLCENMTGYQNLIHMVSLGFSEGFYMKPRIDMELLRTHHEGLICLSACLAGRIPRALSNGDYDGAKAQALEFAEIFGQDRFFLEIQDHGIADQQRVNNGLYRMSAETGLGLVATNDAHYLTQEDAKIQDVLMAIQMGKTTDDPTRMKFETDEFYIKSGTEMAELFSGHEQAIENTVKIAERCNVEFEFGVYHLPEFDVPDGVPAREYLNRLCDVGFAKRYPQDDGTVRARMEYELNMIDSMGFVDYFLIVYDFIDYAKRNGIPVGPGRGSAAGAVVAYCLNITDLDPIRYSLYFERFLNPERVSMPDIDIDFCYVRRPEVIRYVTEKYGAEHVAQIITFGTMAARGAIRDVGRALSIPYNDVDAVAKQIPMELHITIEKALTMNAALKSTYDSDPVIRNLIDTARKLEGMPRNASTHAAGVVITRDTVDTYVPLARNGEQMVTQYTMVTLEELGLLKMDFLGLRTLTVIDDAEKMVRRRLPDFCMENVPLDDAATYEMLSQGKTEGVFQLESTGITSVVSGLRPTSIEDITAVVALYRPGPMQSIPRYIECRHNPSKVRYAHALLEPILSVTYGCMVYQEQVMEVFRILAGYSLGKADMVRRAMSKKKLKELERERVNFIYGNEELGIVGALKNGVEEAIAASIFDQILDFANYAFNKAHAVCYALVSYQTAYLKCHYPREFMAALLTSVLDVSDKVSEYIAETRDMGLHVLPPDVNESFDGFSVSGEAVRFGMAAVRGVGRGFMRALVVEREKGGKFTSLQSFCERMYPNELNRRALESLIKAGAFDTLGYRRVQLLAVYDRVLDAVVQNAKTNLDGQLDLFGAGSEQVREIPITLPDLPELSRRDRLSMEKETTGLYLSGHPMDDYRTLAQQANAAQIRSIVEDGGVRQYKDGAQVRMACVVTGIRQKATKSGAMMAYVVAEDVTGSIELVVFPRTLQASGDNLKEDSAILLTGRIDVREDEPPKIVVNEVMPLTEESVSRLPNAPRSTDTTPPQPSVPRQQLYLRVSSMDCPEIEQMQTILRQYHGTMQVILCLQEGERKKKLKAPPSLWVRKDLVLLEKLQFLLGENNAIIK